MRSSSQNAPGAILPVSAMLMSAPSLKVQPVRSISAVPELYSSIHSSLEEAEVPAHATSLMITASGGVSVAVAVGVGAVVAVALGVGEGVIVSVGVVEAVGVGVGRKCCVGVSVCVGVKVCVGVNVLRGRE
ncbi:hypothetical protein EMGBS3_13350 [Anaerolineaceae bacterium]|nr:hypothetical protein EMGBS3_13350 [Anaerolineaceae bacterium]